MVTELGEQLAEISTPDVAIRYSHPLDRTFHASGDKSRRCILAAIGQKGSCSAGELVKLFDFAQPTVSKHLRVLETAGLLRRHANGRHRIFTLSVAPLKQADGWLQRHLSLWENSLDKLASVLESSHAERHDA